MQINDTFTFFYTGQVNGVSYTNKVEKMGEVSQIEEVENTDQIEENAPKFIMVTDYVSNYLDERGKAIWEGMDETEKQRHSGDVVTMMILNASERFREKYGRDASDNPEDFVRQKEIMTNGEWSTGAKGNITGNPMGSMVDYLLWMGSGVNADMNPDSPFTKFATLYKSGYAPLNEEV